MTLGQIVLDVAGWCGLTSIDASGLDQTVLLQLTLRTLAQAKIKTGLGTETVQDGIYK